MRTAILSLFAVAALVVSAPSADALPPRYISNNNGALPQPTGPYYYSYSGAPIYNQNYIYPGYAYPYYYFNGTVPPNGNYNGSNGRGVMHPAPMSWRYGGYRDWNGRP
ncbi:hypothetical protein [Frigoriglobus tundricola]|uniref:Uncharacterized protein n=1 Tax=Frigoriglobus tundricola TaxID=2774151 RepID=A0A6M5YVP0_9BACT|nr:hypothetical protein [Frigoriglobus tundricola]QJW97371.1 hypothetical protein FTUN_4945 [Frigoriglobus tundricola]